MRSEDDIKIGREIFLRSFFPMRPPPRLAMALVSVMSDHHFEPGDVVFEAGEPPTDVFFVVEGEVCMQEDDAEAWTFHEQSVIGIVDAVLGRPRLRRAVVQKPSHLLSLRYADYLEILEDDFDFAKAALENAHRNIHQNSRQLAPHGVFKPPGTTPVISGGILEQRPLNLIERLLVFYNAPFFLDAPVQPLVSLAAQAEEERWSAGTVLFEPGEPSTALRFVVCGRVRASLDAPKVEGWFGPGDLIGAHAAVGFTETQYRVTVVQDAVILRVQKEDLFDLMEDHSRLTRVGFAFVARENERVRTAPNAERYLG